MKHGYIYKITIGPNYYYGRTQRPRERRGEHLRKLRNNRHPNEYMQNTYNKYGGYSFELIKEVPVERLADEEACVLKESKGDEKCLNARIELPGGSHRQSEATKRKISRALKGHSVSKETRKKISEAGKGRKPSKESIKKSVKARMAVYGGHSEETRRKQSVARRRTVNRTYIMISPHGGKHVFKTQKEIADFFGVNEGILSRYFRKRAPWPTMNRSPLAGWTGYYE